MTLSSGGRRRDADGTTFRKSHVRHCSPCAPMMVRNVLSKGMSCSTNRLLVDRRRMRCRRTRSKSIVTARGTEGSSVTYAPLSVEAQEKTFAFIKRPNVIPGSRQCPVHRRTSCTKRCRQLQGCWR